MCAKFVIDSEKLKTIETNLIIEDNGFEIIDIYDAENVKGLIDSMKLNNVVPKYLYEAVDFEADNPGGMIVFSTILMNTLGNAESFMDKVKYFFDVIWKPFINNLKVSNELKDLINKYEVLIYSAGRNFKGSYTNKNGITFNKTSFTINISAVDSNTMKLMATEICREFQQETLMVRDFNDAAAKVYFVNNGESSNTFKQINSIEKEKKRKEIQPDFLKIMEEEQKPKATPLDFVKRAALSELAKNSDPSDSEYYSRLADIRDWISCYRWYPELVFEGDKCGIVSLLGEVILPVEFEDIKFFDFLIEKQSVVSTKKNGKWGLVKIYTGENVTGFIYDYMPLVSANIIPVMKNGKWGYIRESGEFFTPIEYDIIFNMRYYTPIYFNTQSTDGEITLIDGISLFEKGGRYGVTNGIEISNPVFDEIYPINSDVFISGKRDGVIGYIDKEGEFTTDYEMAYWMTEH